MLFLSVSGARRNTGLREPCCGNARYVESNVRMVSQNKLGGMWKEDVTVKFQVK